MSSPEQNAHTAPEDRNPGCCDVPHVRCKWPKHLVHCRTPLTGSKHSTHGRMRLLSALSVYKDVGSSSSCSSIPWMYRVRIDW